LQLAARKLDPLRFDESIQNECRSCLALTIPAVAAMYKERITLDEIADTRACTTALEFVFHGLKLSHSGLQLKRDGTWFSTPKVSERRYFSGFRVQVKPQLQDTARVG